MDNASNYTSELPWIWVIEALASFKEVNFSILLELYEIAPELPHHLGKNMREMLALRCLEGIFGPRNGITNDACSCPASKVAFDLSESCLDVLQRIVHETLPSDLKTAGPDLLKWDVHPFLAHKRACMPKLALQELKESILEGSRPYAGCLKERSGLAFTNEGDGVLAPNVNYNLLKRWVDGSCFDAQHIGAKGNSSSRLTKNGNKLLQSDLHNGDLHNGDLHKRKRDLASDYMVGDSHEHQSISNDSGNPSIDAKKQKQFSSSSSESVEENLIPLFAVELLEHSSERVIPVVQQESCAFAKDQLGTREEGRVSRDDNDEYVASVTSGQGSGDLHDMQLEIPNCATMTSEDTSRDTPSATMTAEDKPHATMTSQDTSGDKCLQNISIDKVKEKSENCAEGRLLTGDLPFCGATMMVQDISVDKPCQKHSIDEVGDDNEQDAEPRASSCPLEEGFRENAATCNCEDDVPLKAPNAATLEESLQKIIYLEAEEDMDCCREEGTSSDSDGYHVDNINVSLKRHEFLSSQCTYSHDSSAGWTENNCCVMCNEGSQLLVCSTSHCPLMFHEVCLGSSPSFDDNDNFYCPFCACSLANSKYIEAKKKRSLAKKEAAEFVIKDLVPLKKELVERLDKEKHSLSSQNEDEGLLVRSYEKGCLEGRISDQNDHEGGDVNEVNNLHSSGIIDDKQLAEPSATCDNVSSSVKQGEANLVTRTPNTLTKENGGDKTVIQGHNQQATQDHCDGDNLSCRNLDVIPVNQRFVEEGTQEGVLGEQIADPPAEPICALDIYAEGTSQHEKDESIISSYSIRFRRQERHEKGCVSSQMPMTELFHGRRF